VLKKAGIVVVAATAGLLAVSPIAFADDEGGNNNNIVPIQNNTLQVNPQICGNPVLSGNALAVVVAKASADSKNNSKCKQDNSIDNNVDN
jgi:hypothetical protein